MSSVIEGFSYDIFISYRQKDNKGDRWVSEFVAVLKDELEATFKENISIYYDENPHDGLLETHDVDASLKEKMRCLVFIPIISRTYCDPNAFAWEHEFMAFVKQASEDKFGLKVSLPSGNVATRVLPVRIHELSPEDTRLVESVLGGIMRGVDFIYKSPGVNRPLRSAEDHPQDNQNKTYYRDQINKVANAISDIVHSLKYGKTESTEKVPGQGEVKIESKTNLQDHLKILLKKHKIKRSFYIIIIILVCLFAGYFIYKSAYLSKIENKIAVLRLHNTFNDTTLIAPAAEFIEALNEKLSIVRSISKTPGFLTDKFDETEKSFRLIRKDLKSGYVLTGKIRRENNEIKIIIEFSTTKDIKLLWSNSYTWSNEHASITTSEIVRVIASRMEIRLTPEEEKQIDKEISDNPDVNMRLISANVKLKDAWDFYNYRDKFLDSSSFISAITAYNEILKKDSTIAEVYAKRSIARSWGFYLEQIDSTNIDECMKDIQKARSINNNIPDIDIALGFYYYYCTEDYEEALRNFQNAAQKDPQNYQPFFYMALVNRRLGNWKECQNLIHRVIKSNPQEALFLTNIGMTYSFLHKYDSALIYHQKAIDQIPYWPAGFKNKFETLILKNGATSEAISLIEESIKSTGDNMKKHRVLISMYQSSYSNALQIAENSSVSDFDFKGEKYLYMARLSKALNNQTNANRYYESARIILSQSLKKSPKDVYLHGGLALAYAGLGEKSKAIEEGEKAIQMASRQNRMEEIDMKINLAQIYTLLGDYDNAYSFVSYSLTNPSFFSKQLLYIDPIWKPLLDHPEYKKKIKNLEN